MPEGHSVHRIARQFARHFVGHEVAASSPQGRFAAGAARIDRRTMIDSRAVGKQMFLEFDTGDFLRVHLGMYGAWDFAGEVALDATAASANGRMGQTNQRGTVVGAFEDSLSSIGAPRRTRLRMAEQESLRDDGAAVPDVFPPDPIGQVRVRLLTETVVADLRGPTACDVLEPLEVAAVIAKLGPDPLVDDLDEGEARFVATVRRKPTPIGLLLMDQSVVSGIGNVYRAELLFRARLNPHTPGRNLTDEQARGLWRDWVHLLRVGVDTGQMMTIEDLDPEAYARALASRDDRHWVYHRTGEPCRVCGTPIVMEIAAGRKLYWCPKDQA
ncbi:endonuclease-8 [Diaminobutyricimonas aerilata]|uniref:DNA-(apurinic or apyrimidinic site) lyase n=1 Tax=Diaminobutyricimonas aerilata TaxID=1162967 RepID=A0A2M9CJ74_9MICO|nr:DNA-formamidopyrimidine glycosylase family protein [Diaminobutyricimonas aerilata]PJJ71918.1 endonuclease-8 [Diaminobutyricimonas aerilata]